MRNDFLWGSATAAYQCEGAWNKDGKGVNIWDEFCHSDRNVKKITGDLSCDFYHNFKEDIKLLAESGQNTYRFSISWSRIVPKEDRIINKLGLEFYNDVLLECEKHNIIPNVTLVHYDLPDYIGKKGGWLYEHIADEFAYFCKTIFEYFKNRIPLYVTINEPTHNASCSYLIGNYPPNMKSFQLYVECIYRMVVCNAKAIQEFRKLNLNSKIGLVHASCSVDILNDNEEYKKAQKYCEWFINGCVLDPAITGKFDSEMIQKIKDSNIDLSFVRSDELEVIKHNTIDFLGQNAYCRNVVKPYTKGKTTVTVNNSGEGSAREGKIIEGWFETDYDESMKFNSWGREIYPKCIYDCLIRRKYKYGDIPIYITECGHGAYDIADEQGYVEDDDRIKFINDFIYWTLKAKKEGCNVKGFYVWSTMDLYSWINGYEKRYGLVRVDYNTSNLKRIPKKSYYWYKNFINEQQKNNVI